MALFSFDKYNQSEVPNFYLSNPDGRVLFNLGTIYNRKFELRFNTLSKCTFTAPKYVDGNLSDYYSWLQYRRLINVEGIGVFMITGIEVENDGVREVKNITGESLETSLNYKKLTLFEGGYYFYNSIKPEGTLFFELMRYIPGWTIGDIDPDLDTVYADPAIDNLYRVFEIADKSLYDMMINDVSQTYQCTFAFDTINKTVSVYKLENATTLSDIYISFDNLIRTLKLSESTEELATALTVIGGEGLEVNLVNPLGTSTIYNFDYYKSTDWMTQGLIDALTDWEDKVDFYQPTYANLLTDLQNQNYIMVNLQAVLAGYNADLAALQIQKDAAIQAKQSTTAIQAQINAVENLITTTENQMDTQQGIINGIQGLLSTINYALSFENPDNFTNEQVIELNEFIIGNTYTNTNYIQTSVMSQLDIQTNAQQLYDLGKQILVKISEPRYSFEIDSANFIFLKEYQPFITQLSLGCTITVEIEDGSYVYPALLGIDFDYDNPTEFKMVLSNRLRMDDDKFQYNDLFGSMVDSSVTTNFNSQKWNSASRLYSNISGSAVKIMLGATTSGINNLPVYADNTGGTLVDIGAKYIAPSTFSPELVCEGDTFTYNYCTGWYSVIGRIVFYQAAISTAAISGGSIQPVYISMPFALKNEVDTYSFSQISFENINITAGTNIVGVMAAGETEMALNHQGDALAHTAVIGTELGAATTVIILTGFYFID